MPRHQDEDLRPRLRRARVAAFAFVVAMRAAGALAQGAAVPVGFSFSAPIYAAAPAGDPRLFVAERAGVIRVLQDGAVLGTPFLDISDRVAIPAFSEGGLLGFAFAPEYTQSGVFYVYYTGDGDPSGGFTFESRVSRFTASGVPATSNIADPQETILFRVDQPDINHNGGTIVIRDGFLYLGLGDGGGGGDPDELAQNDASPFGKMLRFDLSQQALPWTPETWAKGLRNPFRFSFDRETGDLWIGDLGQDRFEEVDRIPAGTAAAFVCFPVEQVDGGVRPGQLLNYLPGTIRGIIVSNNRFYSLPERYNIIQQRADVLFFIVGADGHHAFHVEPKSLSAARTMSSMLISSMQVGFRSQAGR